MQSIVGIFDSGVGGLTVAAALHALLPALPVRYIADTAYFPYGERPAAEVEERSAALTAELVAAGCSLVVIACNTASSAALERLRDRFEVPIVGMEPPLKPAVERTRSGRVAVLVTPATARGERLARLQSAYAGETEVVTVPMPGLADLVEGGEVAGERVEQALHRALDGLATGANAIDELAHGVEIPTGAAVSVQCSATGDPEAFEAAVARLRASGVALPPMEFITSQYGVREVPA